MGAGGAEQLSLVSYLARTGDIVREGWRHLNSHNKLIGSGR